MTRTGPKTSEESKKIISALKRGVSAYALVQKGFPKMNVRYYDWKINRPEKYKAFVGKITLQNRKRKEAYNTRVLGKFK